MCLVEFNKKHFARELITRAIKNTQDKDQGKENVELFCYFQTPYDNSKPHFSCDDVNCNYKWIHFTCSKLQKTRKGQPWYCKYCKKKTTIIAKLINLLALRLSKTFSQSTLQILQKFYVALAIVTKTSIYYETNLRV